MVKTVSNAERKGDIRLNFFCLIQHIRLTIHVQNGFISLLFLSDVSFSLWYSHNIPFTSFKPPGLRFIEFKNAPVWKHIMLCISMNFRSRDGIIQTTILDEEIMQFTGYIPCKIRETKISSMTYSMPALTSQS